MKIVIVHYNTPELTTALCCSINKFCKNTEIIIFDNSDKLPFNANIFNNVSIIDNTKNNLINFEERVANFIKNNGYSQSLYVTEKRGSNFGSYKHAITVDYLIKTMNEDFILLDSDVLLKQDILKIVDTNSAFVGSIRQNNVRLYPFIIYFNIEKIQKSGISFCDDVNIFPNYKTEMNDTGGSFLQEALKLNLPYNKIDYNDYIVHYGNGSWKENSTKIPQGDIFERSQLSKFEWLHKYKNLWQ